MAIRRWALVRNGAAHWIFTTNDPAATYPSIDDPRNTIFDPTLSAEIVETTAVSPAVAERDAYDGATWTPWVYPTATRWANVREHRDVLLAKSDWTDLASAPLTAQEKTDWATYRQALRDVPQNNADPANVTWPTPPA